MLCNLEVHLKIYSVHYLKRPAHHLHPIYKTFQTDLLQELSAYLLQ